MKNKTLKIFYIVAGWLFVILGIIGLILPIVPTTPFLLVALACFSRSSHRFHQMLLNNRWVGKDLRQWQETKSVYRKTKYYATAAIIISFSFSIFFLSGRLYLQIMLLCIAIVALFFIWRLKEFD